jgi:NAD(P)-dependent dehydrogenase (short-subunit alcohol dehydrogenase family)
MSAPVAIITGAPQGIGAGVVGGYRRAGKVGGRES